MYARTLSNPVLVLDFTMEMFLGVEIVSSDGSIWFSNIFKFSTYNYLTILER